MDAYMPARFSMNTFFVRHVAAPKRLRHIEGLHRAPICAVYDEGYTPLKQHKNTFPPNNFNENVIKSSGGSLNEIPPKPRKKERLLPPMGQFQTFGLIDDTDRWKDELNSLAASVGLLTNNDLEKQKTKDRERYIKSLQPEPVSVPNTPHPNSPKKPSSSYSAKTSRFNEALNTGRRTSRGSQASRGFSSGNRLQYIVDENEREVWMLQVLCQILQTDSLVDVQSWLVSSNSQEKDQVRSLIDQAMRGLESSGRIENPLTREPVIPKSPLKEAENQGGPVNLDKIQTMIEKMNVKSATLKNDANKFSRHMTPVSNQGGQNSSQNITQNVYKLPDIPENAIENTTNADRKLSQSVNFELPKSEVGSNIYDSSKASDVTSFQLAETEYKSPLSPVFNINIFPSVKKDTTLKKEIEVQAPDGTTIKVDAPAKDFKIEELNVTMLVKDEKSQTLQKINGNWKHENSIPKEKQ